MAEFQRGNNGGNNGGNFRKADAFINFYVEREDGSKAKLCAAPLYMDREDHAGLIQGLNTGSIDLADVQDALLLDFQNANKAKSGFAIGGRKASAEEAGEDAQA